MYKSIEQPLTSNNSSGKSSSKLPKNTSESLTPKNTINQEIHSTMHLSSSTVAPWFVNVSLISDKNLGTHWPSGINLTSLTCCQIKS